MISDPNECPTKDARSNDSPSINARRSRMKSSTDNSPFSEERPAPFRSGLYTVWLFSSSAVWGNQTLPVPPRPCTRITAGPCPLFRSEEHTSELQSLMRISYAVFCLKKKNYDNNLYIFM